MSDSAYLERSEIVEQLVSEPEEVRSAEPSASTRGRPCSCGRQSRLSLREEMANQRNAGNRCSRRRRVSGTAVRRSGTATSSTPRRGCCRRCSPPSSCSARGASPRTTATRTPPFCTSSRDAATTSATASASTGRRATSRSSPPGRSTSTFTDPNRPAKVLIIKGKPLYMFAHMMFQGFVEKAPSEPVPALKAGSPRPERERRRALHQPAKQTPRGST